VNILSAGMQCELMQDLFNILSGSLVRCVCMSKSSLPEHFLKEIKTRLKVCLLHAFFLDSDQ